jgi:hypothetical protein
MDWRCGSSNRAPTLQAWNPVFKLQSHPFPLKKKGWERTRERERIELVASFITSINPPLPMRAEPFQPYHPSKAPPPSTVLLGIKFPTNTFLGDGGHIQTLARPQLFNSNSIFGYFQGSPLVPESSTWVGNTLRTEFHANIHPALVTWAVVLDFGFRAFTLPSSDHVCVYMALCMCTLRAPGAPPSCSVKEPINPFSFSKS